MDIKKKISIIIVLSSLFLNSLFYADGFTDPYFENIKIIEDVSSSKNWVKVTELLWDTQDFKIYKTEGVRSGKEYIAIIDRNNFKDINLDRREEQFTSILPYLELNKEVVFLGTKRTYEGFESTPYLIVSHVLDSPDEVINTDYKYKPVPYIPIVEEIKGKLFIRNTDVPHISISTSEGTFELNLDLSLKEDIKRRIGKYVSLKGKMIVRTNPYYRYIFQPYEYADIEENDLTKDISRIPTVPHKTTMTEGTNQKYEKKNDYKYGNGLILTYNLVIKEESSK